MLVRDLFEVGNRLQYFRKKAGLTQAELAERAGIADRTYADIERGSVNMRMKTFLNICAVLHITPDEVLTARDIEPGVRQEEILGRLSLCTMREKETALRLLEVFIASLNDKRDGEAGV